MAESTPGEWRALSDAAAGADRLHVEPERVLAVMRVLAAESDRLLETARRARTSGQWVGPCGGDPISRDAADAFNRRIDLLVDQCRRYAEDLRAAGHSLAAAARAYGHTEAEIQSALRSPAR